MLYGLTVWTAQSAHTFRPRWSCMIQHGWDICEASCLCRCFRSSVCPLTTELWLSWSIHACQEHRGSVPGARATHQIKKAFSLPRDPCFFGFALCPSEALFPTRALLSALLKTSDDKMSPNSTQQCCSLTDRVLLSVQVCNPNLFLTEPCYLHWHILSIGHGEEAQLLYHFVTVRCPMTLPF